MSVYLLIGIVYFFFIDNSCSWFLFKWCQSLGLLQMQKGRGHTITEYGRTIHWKTNHETGEIVIIAN